MAGIHSLFDSTIDFVLFFISYCLAAAALMMFAISISINGISEHLAFGMSLGFLVGFMFSFILYTSNKQGFIAVRAVSSDNERTLIGF